LDLLRFAYLKGTHQPAWLPVGTGKQRNRQFLAEAITPKISITCIY
jgi:hypothetical protein